jgi:hypothetical protein
MQSLSGLGRNGKSDMRGMMSSLSTSHKLRQMVLYSGYQLYTRFVKQQELRIIQSVVEKENLFNAEGLSCTNKLSSPPLTWQPPYGRLNLVGHTRIQRQRRIRTFVPGNGDAKRWLPRPDCERSRYIQT